jgi:hypothetical protein
VLLGEAGIVQRAGCGLFGRVRFLVMLRSDLTGRMLADGDLELSTGRHSQSDDGALRLPRKLETGASLATFECETL